MITLTEGRHAGEFILSEASGKRSRENITILSGQVLAAGAVLGAVLLGAATPAAVAGNTGAGTIGTVTVGLGAKVGVYRLTCIEPGTGAGKFQVEDPDGIVIGVATVGAAFSGGGLGFTIADGDPDFASGDSFTITVAAGSGSYKLYNPTNTDGSNVPLAILLDNVDASDGAMPGVAIVRDAEVNKNCLEWFSGANDGQKAAALAQLAERGIIGR